MTNSMMKKRSSYDRSSSWVDRNEHQFDLETQRSLLIQSHHIAQKCQNKRAPSTDAWHVQYRGNIPSHAPTRKALTPLQPAKFQLEAIKSPDTLINVANPTEIGTSCVRHIVSKA